MRSSLKKAEYRILGVVKVWVPLGVVLAAAMAAVPDQPTI